MKTLKKKIPIFFLIPTLLMFFIFSGISVYLIDYYIRKLAQNKVQYDLNSAHEIYYNELDRLRNIVKFSSKLYLIKQSISSNDIKTLLSEIQRIRVEEHLDFLSVSNFRGYVIARSRNPNKNGDYIGNDSVIRKALIGEIPVSTEIWHSDKLKCEGNELAEIAKTKLIPTPKAIPTIKKIETSGMVQIAAAPIYDKNFRIIGVIYGGVLLNKNYYLVDKIKETVFGNKAIGTATIFMGDLRISTNVRLKNGKRAVGTRLSKEVYNKVILNGEKWIDRAFVVNSWYITAYEPIYNIKNDVIGSLYVGVLEEPFNKIRDKISLIFVSLLLLGAGVTFFISLIFASRIIAPITKLENSIKKVAKGNYEDFVKIDTDDEIGRVQMEFNNMIRALKDKDDALNRFHSNLENEVKARTSELENKNIELLNARQELYKLVEEKENLIQKYRELQSELVHTSKLAAIGALAGGVAHEINTPIAIIRGNIELLEVYLDEKGFSNSKEMELIKEQVTRMQRIVDRLLQFSKKTDATYTDININSLLEEIVEPLRKMNIPINLNFKEDIKIKSYETQLREVFTNVILNALEAIREKGKGKLDIFTEKEDNSIKIIFKDTGSGIDYDNLRKIFNPFYSTKKDGTGLGLAISLSIIKNLGGDIKIESEKGKGTTVIIILNNG
jgi:two-component system NtrC family sensor kinase